MSHSLKLFSVLLALASLTIISQALSPREKIIIFVSRIKGFHAQINLGHGRVNKVTMSYDK